MDYNEIRSFIDSEGRLTAFPSKRKKKLLALLFLAEKIPSGKAFTEAEFNRFLSGLHTFNDPATLRRELFDYFLINRDKAGREYSINPDRLSPEEILEKYCI